MISGAGEPDRRPLRRVLLAYLLGFFAAWLLLPIALHEEPPDDNFEQLEWARHPALGYDKHPPLPAWILWTVEQLFPAGLRLTYVLGGVQVAVMLGCAWLIGRALLDRRRAWRAVLLCTFITYYTLRMHFYNHNSVLLAATAASFLALVRALRRDRGLDWALLGVCWGAGMLSKYQMVVGIACNLAGLLLGQPRWPSRLRASAIAGAAALLVFAPHGAWLVANDFPPLHYAAKFVAAALPVAARPARLLAFSADQLLRLAPLLALLGLLAWRARLAPPAAYAGATVVWPTPQLASRLLLVHALGPLLLMAGLGLVAGTYLEMHWGTAYLWAIPLWLLSLRRMRRIAALSDATWLAIAIPAQAVLVIGSAVENW